MAEFWEQVQVTGFCWLWTGRVHHRYGYHGGMLVHRKSYLMMVGPIGEDLEVDHLCRVPLCVNPDHLEPVTAEENRRRRVGGGGQRGPRAHSLENQCRNGHTWSEATAYRSASGRRFCRTCNIQNAARYRARRRSTQ